MMVNSLIKVYEEQLTNLNDLLEAAKNKQKSIISNSRESIEKFTALEESVMNRINRKEIERGNLLSSMFSDKPGSYIMLQTNSEQLSALLNQLADDEQLNTLDSVRSEIKNVSEEVKGINIQNRFLIEQANSIVKQTLSAVIKLQKKPIVDRRI